MTDGLFQTPERDGFKHESPIRAFTTFDVQGNYAIGKGFRPSIAHLAAYLDAMQRKEGWRLVQILEAATAPTVIFIKTYAAPMYHINMESLGEPYIPEEATDEERRQAVHRAFKSLDTPGFEDAVISAASGNKDEINRILNGEDDPINPAHYAGRECADIGERLSANGYQILKYCWRLGKKDDPCQELGKATWYGESESDLLRHLARAQGWRLQRPNVTGIKDPVAFLEDRIKDQNGFTQCIARMLWEGYGQGDLKTILITINDHRVKLECGSGLAV